MSYLPLPADYDQLPEAERLAALRAAAVEVDRLANEIAADPDVFQEIDPGDGLAALFFTRACTSLSDEEATARVNLVPSGTSNGWTLCTEEHRAPVPCADKPDTHRHLMWEC